MSRTEAATPLDLLDASPVLVEVLLFFHRNPSTIDRLEGISIWMGRRPEHILPSLEQLARVGVLQPIGCPPRQLYRVSHDPVVWEEVNCWLRRRVGERAAWPGREDEGCSTG